MICLPALHMAACASFRGSPSCLFAARVRCRGWGVGSRRPRGREPSLRQKMTGRRAGQGGLGSAASAPALRWRERLAVDGDTHSAPPPSPPSFRGCFGPRTRACVFTSWRPKGPRFAGRSVLSSPRALQVLTRLPLGN